MHLSGMDILQRARVCGNEPKTNAYKLALCLPARRKRARVAVHAQKQLQAASASVLGSLLAGAVWASEAADVPSTYVPPTVVDVEFVQAVPQQVPSLRASSLDRVLLSIIRATDDLSLAADSLLDLTAASDPSTNTTLIPASAPAPSTALPAAPTLQLNSVLQPVPVLQLSAHETHEAHASTAGQQELSTPQRMSQQALAMAVEALKLATLLEAQADGCDPAEQELLQQIAAAARLVSVMAADIVPAPRPQAADSNSGRGDLAPAGSMHGGGSSAALAAAPENAPAEAAGAAGAAAGSVSGNALPRFAGLPVLGIQQEACHTPDEVAAAALKSLTCLHL